MSDNDFKKLRGKALMEAYKFISIGTISAPDHLTFAIQINLEEAQLWEKSIYIFLFGDEIARIGSSKDMLGKRMRRWGRDVTNAFREINGQPAIRTSTPEWEAREWIKLLRKYTNGEIYARKATIVTTSIGTFSAYMDEESILINRHKPRLNRHTNR